MKSISTKLFYCFIALVMLFSNTLKAQKVTEKITVRGKVIDKADKNAIIGGSVVERDKDMRYITGVATDIDGNFAIKISNPANLISFSYLGTKQSSSLLRIKLPLTLNLNLLLQNWQSL